MVVGERGAGCSASNAFAFVYGNEQFGAAIYEHEKADTFCLDLLCTPRAPLCTEVSAGTTLPRARAS